MTTTMTTYVTTRGTGRRAGVLAGVLAVLLTAIVGLTTGAAGAQPYPVTEGDLGTNQSTGLSGGSTVLVQGSGFRPGATVTITLGSDQTVLLVTTADATGAFTASVAIPAGFPAGTHELLATGLSPTGTLVLSETVTVADPTGTVTDTGLALTGRSVAATLLVAAALGGAGYGMVVVSRRVRHS